MWGNHKARSHSTKRLSTVGIGAQCIGHSKRFQPRRRQLAIRLCGLSDSHGVANQIQDCFGRQSWVFWIDWFSAMSLGPDERTDHRPAGSARLDRTGQSAIRGRGAVRTGSPLRDLPEAFGDWNSVFRRLRRWSRKGVCRGRLHLYFRKKRIGCPIQPGRPPFDACQGDQLDGVEATLTGLQKGGAVRSELTAYWKGRVNRTKQDAAVAVRV